jgi:predicted nucleic acid-binding protein
LIVIDASAVLELLLRTSRAEQLLRRVFEFSERLHAPHLLDVEVNQALRRLLKRKEIALLRAMQALEDFADLLIERHAHAWLGPRVWQLCRGLTAYDATYVALAEAMDAPLLTCDAKLARAQGHRAKIELIGA